MECFKPLLRTIVAGNKPNQATWTHIASIVKELIPQTPPTSEIAAPTRSADHLFTTTERRIDDDDVIKEEVNYVHVDSSNLIDTLFPNFKLGEQDIVEAVIPKCISGNHFSKEQSWKDWPTSTTEANILSWFQKLVAAFERFALTLKLKVSQKLYVGPNSPIGDSGRKPDIGFIDSSWKEGDAIDWSQILVVGELKKDGTFDTAGQAWFDLVRYVREIFSSQPTRRFVLGITLCGPIMRVWRFDRAGGLASEGFNIKQEAGKFIRVIFGFFLMSKEDLGFNPSIENTSVDGQYAIEVLQNSQTERIILKKLLRNTRSIVGRGTAYWKAVSEKSEPLTVKLEWREERHCEEADFLLTAKSNVSVANLYKHHCLGSLSDYHRYLDNSDAVKKFMWTKRPDDDDRQSNLGGHHERCW